MTIQSFLITLHLTKRKQDSVVDAHLLLRQLQPVAELRAPAEILVVIDRNGLEHSLYLHLVNLAFHGQERVLSAHLIQVELLALQGGQERALRALILLNT